MNQGLHEIACPSCAATYQLPADAIGAKGRRLACSVCDTQWRAMPGDLRPVAEPAPSRVAAPDPVLAGVLVDAPGWSTPPAPSRADWRADEAPPAAPPPATQPAPPNAERIAQMAEIRQMLAELKTPGPARPADAAAAPRPRPVDAVPAPRPEPERTVLQPTPPEREPEPEYSDDVDPLRARLAQHGVMAKAHRAEPVKNPYDRKKLMRKHDRKIRRRRLQDGAGSGAFVTGFLLIIMVAASMTAIYILHPQIIARFPGMETALLDYVATIDGLRVTLAQTTTDIIGWIRGRLVRE